MEYLEDLKFEEEYINKCLNEVDKSLILYVNDDIYPEYSMNDGGHNNEHINYVLKRAFEISKNYDINYNILYACVAFHDIACHINRDEHEILSAKRAYENKFLNNFFTKVQMEIIKEAITDHRASLEYAPRNIYGKILSSADRKVEVKVYLYSSLSFGLKSEPNLTMEGSINRSYEFAIKKFGKNGYAITKSYVHDEKYQNFLKDIQYLIDNKEEYYELAKIVYEQIESSTKQRIVK